MHFRYLVVASVALLLTACVTPDVVPDYLDNNTQTTPQKPLKFQTNQSTFLISISDAGQSVENRNRFMDEFLLKSDMQCEHFLNSPVVDQQPQTNEEKSLYMSMFDTMSFLFGTKYLTDVAKGAFSDNSAEAQADKEAYKNALSTEIQQGVKIARSRYAQQMIAKKGADLNAYSINDMEKDMLVYDQQCSEAYGLVEINRALRDAQHQMTQPQAQTVPAIDPTAIKAKVEAVSKQVEEDKVNKDSNLSQ